jgi:hypothetical protein
MSRNPGIVEPTPVGNAADIGIIAVTAGDADAIESGIVL